LSGGTSGQQVEDAQAEQAGDVGNIAVGTDGANYRFIKTDADGHLQVDVLSGGTTGQQVEDGELWQAGDAGNIAVGYDGTNYRFIETDVDGHLQVDALTLPNITLASQANPFTTDINVSLDGEQVDISDRAVRDLGKVDIAAFDASLPTGTNEIGKIQITDGTNEVDILDDSGTYRLQVEAKIAAGGAPQDAHPVDTNGLDMDVALDVARPANTRSLIFAGLDDIDYVRVPSVVVDSEDGKNRIAIEGKVSTSPPEPPAATTPVTIDGSNPLDLTGTDTEDWIIPNGETFTLTQLIAGAEGDPTEKGSKVEVRYVDSSSVEHLISRVYITGFTTEIYPATSQTRDGTSLTGDGVTTAIRIYREHFGGGTRELDAVVRGYY